MIKKLLLAILLTTFSQSFAYSSEISYKNISIDKIKNIESISSLLSRVSDLNEKKLTEIIKLRENPINGKKSAIGVDTLLDIYSKLPDHKFALEKMVQNLSIKDFYNVANHEEEILFNMASMKVNLIDIYNNSIDYQNSEENSGSIYVALKRLVRDYKKNNKALINTVNKTVYENTDHLTYKYFKQLDISPSLFMSDLDKKQAYLTENLSRVEKIIFNIKSTIAGINQDLNNLNYPDKENKEYKVLMANMSRNNQKLFGFSVEKETLSDSIDEIKSTISELKKNEVIGIAKSKKQIFRENRKSKNDAVFEKLFTFDLTGKDYQIKDIMFSPNMDLIAFSGAKSDKGFVKVININNKQSVFEADLESPVEDIEYSPNGLYLSAVSKDNLTVLQSKDGKLSKEITDGVSGISVAKWDKESKLVYTNGNNSTSAWNIFSGKKALSFDQINTYNFTLASNDRYLMYVKSLPENKAGSEVYALHLETNNLRGVFENSHSCSNLSFSTVGNSFLCNAGEQVKLWSFDGYIKQIFKGINHDISDVTFANKNKFILAANKGNNKIKIWEKLGYNYLPMQEISGEQDPIVKIVVSRNSYYLAAIDESLNKIIFWRIY